MDLPRLLAGLGVILGGALTVRSAWSEGRATDERLGRLDFGRRGPMLLKSHEVNTIEERLALIRKMTDQSVLDPDVRAYAAHVLSRKCGESWCVAERDYLGELQALYLAVRRDVRYTRDTDKMDTFQAAARTLELGIGDCDCISILLASLLRSVGYPARFRIIRGVGAPDWSHIFVLAGVPPQNPSKWIPMDASLEASVGWQPAARHVLATRDFPA